MKSDLVLHWTVRQAVGLEAGLLPNGAAWSAALEPLSANRLSALAGWLLGPRLSDMPDDVHQALSRAQAKAMFANDRSGVQLQELATALEHQSFPWVVLKGLPLAERLYPDPICRPGRDLDVLVDPSAIEPVGSVLMQLGYQAEATRRHTHHRRYLRPFNAGWDDIVELHWRAEPDSHGAVSTGEILRTRRRVDTRWGGLWTPGPEVELDLLVRHYVRHAGWQLILLVDILLLQRGLPPATHPLGAVVADDLKRLGLEPGVTGPFRFRQLPLRRWLARHDFADRRTTRRAAPIEVALAQWYSAGSWLSMLGGLLWPATPSFRWQAMSSTPWGRRTWRWYRLLTLGRGARGS
jgi:hypothetical protein